jgi:excisionase family DNA binding protein
MGHREEVTKLRETGLSYRGIGRQLGISRQAAWQAVNPKPKKKREIGSNLASDKIMLRAGEAALLLGVHANTIRRWGDKRILEAYIISARGDRRFRRTELESFLKQGRQRWERS